MASNTIRKAETKAVNKTRETVNTPVVEGLARAGYIARGVIYFFIGVLAVQLAFSGGGKATDQTGAMQLIGAQPFGKILLILLVIGLFGYALWGVIRAFFDPLGRGSDTKGIIERIGFFISAVTYGAFAVIAANYMIGYGNASGVKSQDIAAQLFGLPFGMWLVVLLGVFWLVAGAGGLYTAWKAEFKKDLRPSLDANEKRWAEWLGRFGYGARGIVFLVVSFLTIQAGLTENPKQPTGFDSALLQLARGPNGIYLLGVVALGLVAFGIYSMLCARWMVILPNKDR